jgi:hypothetical protein
MLMTGVVAIVLVYNSDQQTTLPTICSSNNTLKIILSKKFQLGDEVISHTSVTSKISKIIVMPK